MIVVAFGSSLKIDINDAESLNDATSGRFELMEGGIDLAREKPLLGWGSGSFNAEYRSHERSSGARGDGGVAHDPDHGRRRAGDHRARGLRGVARARASCGC